MLHLVTSAHALRVLLPWLDDDVVADALGHYWLAYAAGHVASGLAQGVGAAPPGVALPWATIVARAIASDDDHLIKLVDSCREQERAYGGDGLARGGFARRRAGVNGRLAHPQHRQRPRCATVAGAE